MKVTKILAILVVGAFVMLSFNTAIAKNNEKEADETDPMIPPGSIELIEPDGGILVPWKKVDVDEEVRFKIEIYLTGVNVRINTKSANGQWDNKYQGGHLIEDGKVQYVSIAFDNDGEYLVSAWAGAGGSGVCNFYKIYVGEVEGLRITKLRTIGFGLFSQLFSRFFC